LCHFEEELVVRWKDRKRAKVGGVFVISAGKFGSSGISGEHMTSHVTFGLVSS